MTKAKVIEIKRFAVHDGDGIRTTVFLKGCPLKCIWCHNPESIAFPSQLAFFQNKCVSCGMCIPACPKGAHRLENGRHIFDRNWCVACGKCEAACLYGALALQGREMTVSEILPVLVKDKDFYDASGGGVTLSGGECLMHPDFCAELLKKLKETDIHTAVDTCGFVSKATLDKVMPYTDIFLYDMKAYDEDVHIRYTGQSNAIILENLKYLDACGAKVEIRIPYVPGCNADQIEKIALFLQQIKNITKVRILPYHNYAGSKYASLQMENTLPDRLPTNEELQQAKDIIKSYSLSLAG